MAGLLCDYLLFVIFSKFSWSEFYTYARFHQQGLSAR